jgi:acetyl esterase/lipase
MDLNSFVGYSLSHGRCLASHTVGDAAAGLSYVLSRKEADPNRAGVLGFSSGGLPAVFLAALDDRIDAVVASGCITSFDSLFQYSRRSSVEAVPGLAEWLETSDCLCMVAPRPMLVQWGELDIDPETRCASLTPASKPTVEVARQAYAVLGHQNRLETLVSANLGHEVDVPAAVDFFRRVMPIHDAQQVSSSHAYGDRQAGL